MNFDHRNNDFWTPLTRDNYDRWKLASPEDEQQQEEKEEDDERTHH
jgi:hypothetical protein